MQPLPRILLAHPTFRLACPSAKELVDDIHDSLFRRLLKPDRNMLLIMCRLLQEHTAGQVGAVSAYANARLATRLLGQPWPLTPGILPNLPGPLAEPDEDEALSEAALTSVVFSLLAPDYKPEIVELQLLLPQTVEEALEVLDTCRSQVTKSLFPGLQPVCPQPDPRWGFVLLLPDWASERAIVCIDLSMLDGPIFAAAAAPDVDKHILLNMAGLSGAAEVDILVPGFDRPIVYGEEVRIETGMCISLVPLGTPVGFQCLLGNMLRTHLPWAPAPPEAQDLPEDRFCLVADGLYCSFLLLPERSMFYRADIAARLGLPYYSMALSPANPRQEDVSMYGRACRTVVAAGISYVRDADVREIVGFLDCRPVLEGWKRLPTDRGWLDLFAIRTALQQAAPEGLQVCISGCRPHWTWLWIEPGQVLQVRFEPSIWASDQPADLHIDGTSHPGEVADATSDDNQDGPNAPSHPPAEGPSPGLGAGYGSHPALDAVSGSDSQPEGASGWGNLECRLTQRKCMRLVQAQGKQISPFAWLSFAFEAPAASIKWSAVFIEDVPFTADNRSLTPDVLAADSNLSLFGVSLPCSIRLRKISLSRNPQRVHMLDSRPPLQMRELPHEPLGALGLFCPRPTKPKPWPTRVRLHWAALTRPVPSLSVFSK